MLQKSHNHFLYATEIDLHSGWQLFGTFYPIQYIHPVGHMHISVQLY